MKYSLIVILFIISQTAAAQKLEERRECVQKDGDAVEVSIIYNTETSAKTITIKGKQFPFENLYPTDDTYAKNQTWYINNEKISFNKKQYEKYGLPRVLSAGEVEGAGNYKGVTVFVETGDRDYEAIYLFVQPGCEFQPYIKVIEPKK